MTVLSDARWRQLFSPKRRYISATVLLADYFGYISMTVLLADYFGYSSTLKMEAVIFSETSLHFYDCASG
jgi:hypothetical protein